jgi:hypothetical protein
MSKTTNGPTSQDEEDMDTGSKDEDKAEEVSVNQHYLTTRGLAKENL